MLPMYWHSRRLLRHGLAPFLGSGLVSLVPFWRLPAQTLELALLGPLSSPRNTICLSAPLPASWGHGSCLLPCCYFTHAAPPSSFPVSQDTSFSPTCCLPLVTLSPSCIVGWVPGPGTSLAQSLRTPTLKLDSAQAAKEESCLCSSLTSSWPPTSGLTR